MYKLCKTEQSALRQRQMEEGLLNFMRTRRYEDISISDLCSHIGIPRKSFYRYFSSKDGALYALIDHTFMEFDGFSGAYRDGEPRTLERDLESFFLFWKERRLILDALERSGLGGILLERAIGYVQNQSAVSRFLPDDDAETREYIANFSICGIMIMMLNWHSAGYQQRPRDMARIAARLLSKPLFPHARSIISS